VSAAVIVHRKWPLVRVSAAVIVHREWPLVRVSAAIIVHREWPFVTVAPAIVMHRERPFVWVALEPSLSASIGRRRAAHSGILLLQKTQRVGGRSGWRQVVVEPTRGRHVLLLLHPTLRPGA
jgi:hypothetical protein